MHGAHSGNQVQRDSLPTAKYPKRKSAIEEALSLQLRLTGAKPPEREYRFHPERKWRLDFAWPAQKLGAECEGGIWTNGAHTRGAHFTKDCEKYNTATLMGWRIFRFTTDMVKDGTALKTITEALA